MYVKSKEHWKILKTTSDSSPRIDLSNNVTFSWPQSRATVPLTSEYILSNITKLASLTCHSVNCSLIF
jgi:hypothetical protein